MRFSRAVTKFLLGYFLVHFVIAAIFLFVLTAWLRDQMLVQTRHRMQDLSYALRQHVRSLPLGMHQPELESYLNQLESTTEARFTLIDQAGNVVIDSRTGSREIGNHSDRPEVRDARSKGVGFQQRTSTTLGVPLFYLAIPMIESESNRGQPPAGFVRVAVEEDSVFATISALQKFLWLFTIGTGLFAGLLMVIYTSREMKPLHTFASAARSIASGQYAMLPGIAKRDDEWKSLSDAFEFMQAELQQREARLLENSLRIEAVLGSMVEGVLAVDSEKRVLIANQAACELLDTSVANMVGNNLVEIVRSPELGRALNHTLLTQSAIQTEFDTSGSSRRRLLEVRVTPLSEQRDFGATVVMHDVTELRALETMRRDFVANVSHELKTPLASIKAYAETLRLGAIDDKTHNVGFVQQIEEQAEVLDHQIADLLKLSELESGKSTFQIVRVDMRQMFARCHDRFCAEAKRRDLKLLIDMPNEPCAIETDQQALRTILDNLVSNALRYARPAGFVKMSAEQGDVESTFSVTDDGIGISLENQERIFERFYRVDSARSRDLGGTGLGLAIVKHTVIALGGKISVHSKPGQGSTFTVALPGQVQGDPD